MKRRDFLRCGSAAAGTALLGLHRFPHHLYASTTKKTAQDLVTLGKTGIQVTRLAQGTGTNGVSKSSNQIRKMGDQGLSELLVRGVDNGVRFWDLADQYGSHPHAKRALGRSSATRSSSSPRRTRAPRRRCGRTSIASAARSGPIASTSCCCIAC